MKRPAPAPRQALIWAALLLSHCTGLPASPPAAPAQCLPADFCYVDTVALAIRTELKYAGSDNFVGRPIAGYSGRRAILRRDAAEALARADALLAPQGYGLKIYDAYRPAGAMEDFYRWSKTDDERMKARFYPNITKRGIYEGRYIGTTSEHSWGIAVDITLTRRRDGKECDMGGHHDLLDPSSATDYPHLSEQQRANRQRLRRAMEAAGMRNYSAEWWHYYLHPTGTCYAYGFPLNDALPPSPRAAHTR